MKKLVITGASGVIGRALAKTCSSKYDVVGTYHDHDFKPDYMKLRHLDLTDSNDIESCLDTVQPSIVIHTAGLSDLQYCEKNTQVAENVNYRASAQLAAFCTQRAIRLVHVSTDMVFDGSKGNYNEEDTPSPINQYGRSKFSAEEAVKSICENYVIARLNLVFGHGEAVKKTFTDRILIANWSQKPYSVYEGQTRTPISIEAASRAITELAVGEFTGIYNLGGAENIERWEFALKLVTALKMDHSVIEKTEIPEEFKGIYPADTSFDTSKAQADLKTNILTLDEGLKLEYGKYID